MNRGPPLAKAQAAIDDRRRRLDGVLDAPGYVEGKNVAIEYRWAHDDRGSIDIWFAERTDSSQNTGEAAMSAVPRALPRKPESSSSQPEKGREVQDGTDAIRAEKGRTLPA